MSDLPLISAIMLIGNRPIQDILSSITAFQAQTYPNKELIIVNNTTTQLAASELNIPATKNVFLIDTPHKLWAGMARNYGISAANGPILAQFDINYWSFPERFAVQVQSLAEHEAKACVLTNTLSYSYASGRTSYNINKQNAILNTMLFVRPAKIDYPNVMKNEEFGLLDKLTKNGHKLISIDRPDLCCQLHFNSVNICKITDNNISNEHVDLITQMLRKRLKT